MSPVFLRLTITAILVFHGVGQLMGAIPAMGLFGVGSSKGPDWAKNWSANSWLLTDLLGSSASRIIAAILFIVAFTGFICGAFSINGLLIPVDIWRRILIISAVISLWAIFLYWNAFILLFFHKIGNIVINLAVLVALLYVNWPTQTQLGY